MERYVSQRRGNRDDHHEVGTALIEGINGNDEDGATPSLLMTANGIRSASQMSPRAAAGPVGMDQGA